VKAQGWTDQPGQIVGVEDSAVRALAARTNELQKHRKTAPQTLETVNFHSLYHNLC
jgi:hypothetical protein